MFGVQLHSMGLSVREVDTILELLGIDRSHGAVWDWTHELAEQQEDPQTTESLRVRRRQDSKLSSTAKKCLFAATGY